MANNFTAEKTDSGGEIFATRQIGTSSVHYPVGLIAWGSSGSESVTSSSSPFPVQLFGNGLSSTLPLFVNNNSGQPLFVRGVGSSSVPVTNDTSTPLVVRGLTNSAVTVSLSGNASVVTSSAAPLHVRGLTDSHVAVTGDSGSPVFVRGLGDSTLPVSGTVAVTHAGLAALSSAFTSSDELKVQVTNPTNTTVTAVISGNASVVTSTSAPLHVRGLTDSHVAITNDSGNPIFVRGLTNSGVNVINSTATALVVRGLTNSGVNVINDTATPIVVRGVGSSSVPITGSSTTQIGTVTNPAADSLGLTPFTASVSSVVTTVKGTVGRLYGWYISNPSSNTAGAYLKVYPEDSAGVTLGTSSAALDFWIPPEGAANQSVPGGISLSSGIGVAAAGGAGSTNHAAPPANLTVSLWYA